MSTNLSTIEAITELLFVEDALDSADFIFVFGNDWLPTMDAVAKLYLSGASKRILISGHSARSDRAETEAYRFMERGIEIGIPKDAMILEEKATNTKENLVYSLPIMERALRPETVSSVIFVCKTFHTRRVLMTARAIFAPSVRFGFCPIGDERNITRDNWWTEAGRFERAIAEVRRIAEYTLKGDLTVQ